MAGSDWARVDGPIGAYIRKESQKTLDAYGKQPNLIVRDANHEADTARGGYARRQIFELVQNSADALAGSDGGSIWIELTPTHFYCADEGRPIDRDGVKALMFAYMSPKRGTDEIGRFGLGFKSVLGVTDTPEFFSRSGSFRFDSAKSTERLRQIAPDAEHYPTLTLPEAIDPRREAESDPALLGLMDGASSIVRLPLKPGAYETLKEQIEKFPPEFLLFVEHVSDLTLKIDGQEEARAISLSREDDLYVLEDGTNTTRWMLTKTIHQLSDDAKSDSRSLDNAEEVPISWAVPIVRRTETGRFWAFFPTMTVNTLSGILNAPWKTNEDRQNLLPGVYNDELIDAAAALVADALPKLSTPDDLARHLDALPRLEGAGRHANRLRDRLYSDLHGREIVPDATGELKKLLDVSYPTREFTLGVLPYSPPNKHWVYEGVLRRNLMPRLDYLYSREIGDGSAQLPRASVSECLESYVEFAKRLPTDDLFDSVSAQSSKWAIRVAALLPKDIRESNYLGAIVFTADGRWLPPDPDVVRLSGGDVSAGDKAVHPELEADEETLRALKELGVRSASPTTAFEDFASRLLRSPLRWNGTEHQKGSDSEWRRFWQLSRDVNQTAAVRIIKESNDNWRDDLRIRTVSGRWRSLFESLLPCWIVPADGSRDSDVAIDVEFHEEDLDMLRQLGAASMPSLGRKLSRTHHWKFIHKCRREFQNRDLPRRPRDDLLNFTDATTSGPLDILEILSEEGKAEYTDWLLSLDDTYKRWTMRHNTQDIYPSMEFDSPAIETLREHGRIETDDGIRKLSDGIGDPPRDYAVLRKLLSHPQANSIRAAFGLRTYDDLPVEPIGADDPIPLTDIWPGLASDLLRQQANFQLMRCDGIRRIGGFPDEDDLDCVNRGETVYLTRKDDEAEELRAVLRTLGLSLAEEQVEAILYRRTPADIQAKRDEVRQHSTDEERLLAAVGEEQLRWRLPQSLITILDQQTRGPLTGIQIAQAAIATYHTGALREYRHALAHLDPPKQWSGRPKAVEFVRSLGFSEEWAGDRDAQRDPYIEVDGPFTLPPLHDYQRNVVDNVRDMLRSDEVSGEQRRGMISMPTGSGKTRVAVQSIIEAIRDDGFEGGILWVADRDELCEQAVEAWREVWASEGVRETRLRISRMWAGQPPPLPSGDMHVIVATIQTLSARINNQPEAYEFLADFKLLVFDEAHRSVASSFTSVMQDLGLPRWPKWREPFLVGLTATPYRGHDAQETERLVRRYGQNRLDYGAFASDDPQEVIRELQTMRVLARADLDTIEGVHLQLDSDELRRSEEVPWLPQSVENRIARDPDRTQRIIAAFRKHIDPDWPTLIFATSVEHARTLAALLTSIRVKARAVSGETDPSTRRRVVEEFRRGEIQALVNYGVFREGFDAPKTRAIIVARPVYSPNLYFQMIGRGLRGVKNGGNDRCLVLNVRDNIGNYGRNLAFSELDWLWDN